MAYAENIACPGTSATGCILYPGVVRWIVAFPSSAVKYYLIILNII
jgi:hypothetical protein